MLKNAKSENFAFEVRGFDMTYNIDTSSCFVKEVVDERGKKYIFYIWNNQQLYNKKFKEIIINLVNENWIRLEEELMYYSCIVASDNFLYIYCSRVSDSPIYFYKDQQMKIEYISDDLEKIARNCNLMPDEQRLASLCWGANCIPYKDIRTFKFDVHYVKKSNTVKEINRQRPLLRYDIGSFENAASITKELILNAVEQSLAGVNDKIAITLSGGLDSSILAICLKLLGKSFKCIHWFSKDYAPVDERKFVYDLKEKYKLDIEYLDIGRRTFKNNGYIDNTYNFYWPYNHGSFSWWLDTVKIAQKSECNMLLTGLNGDGLFSHEFNLIDFHKIFGSNFKWKLEYFKNSLSIPFYKAYSKENHKNNNTHISYNDYLWSRGYDIISTRYAKNIDSDQESEMFFQKESLKHNVIYNSDITLIHPYVNDKLIDFSLQIPFYYKVVPFSGVIVQKPLLRCAFQNELPEIIQTRTSKSNFGMLAQRFCEKNARFICDLLNEKSALQKLDIIDCHKVKEVFNSKKSIYSNSYTLIRSCFVELWIKNKTNKA